MFTAVLFTTGHGSNLDVHQQTERIKMWPIYATYGILLRHKKNEIGPSVVMWWNLEFVLLSKSEREKQRSYINAYIWNLQKCHRWTYLQGWNRDADVGDGLWLTQRGKGKGVNWGSSIDVYIRSRVRQIASGKLLYGTGALLCALWWPRAVGWEGEEGGSRGKAYMFMYSWFTSLYGTREHSIINQLHSKKKTLRYKYLLIPDHFWKKIKLISPYVRLQYPDNYWEQKYHFELYARTSSYQESTRTGGTLTATRPGFW